MPAKPEVKLIFTIAPLWMIQLASVAKRLEACIRAKGGHFEHLL